MEEKRGSAVAWGALAVIGVLFLVGIWLEVINDPPPGPPAGWGSGSLADALFTLMVFTFPAVGAVIAARQPGNAIGWIMLAIGATFGVSEVLDGYARYGLTTQPGSLPAPEIALAVGAGTWAPVIGPIGTFLILLFPNGRLPSPRWRPVALLSGFGISAAYVLITAAPGEFADVGYPGIENPLGVELLRPHLDLLFSVLVLIPLSMVGCAAGLITRFRRSRGQERLQMKWLASAGAVVALVYGITMVATFATGFSGRAQEPPEVVLLLQQIATLAFGLISIAIGIAVLRHRLYDIDVIINRTIVYALLTALLTGIYLLAVAAFQGVFRPVTGESDLAVATATLAVAALFRPGRAVTQTFIDRRFYRQRYDAGVTLETFSLRLRDDVDIRTISSALVGVVSQTLQPNHVSLWLREPSTRSE